MSKLTFRDLLAREIIKPKLTREEAFKLAQGHLDSFVKEVLKLDTSKVKVNKIKGLTQTTLYQQNEMYVLYRGDIIISIKKINDRIGWVCNRVWDK